MLHFQTLATALALNAVSVVLAEPLITRAAQLAPRATDPSFVGYISRTGGYGDPRSCDFPQTVSTSGNYVQCCPATGSCPFYTSCSSNTLLAAGTSVACDVNTALMCNTGVVLSTPGTSSGPSYIACWQTSLGTNAFTFVQDIGSANSAQVTASTSAAASGNTVRTTASTSAASTASTGASNTAASMSSSSSKAAAVAGNDANLAGGLLGGFIALLAQALL